ncbi:hypothetical protein [Streptomyces albipurpureus]|uniref:Uncharacterized protein n=1 Tax=Streptomyces albipurpureus TaxID=2897419 RepID=A0ABT0UYS9_9ACTN|nr:hypothetical protein [Streptomyces sp. CWNU-1]MCM2393629.1 hypothetical protein [Streptomyces sp. CWNU-1]
MALRVETQFLNGALPVLGQHGTSVGIRPWTRLSPLPLSVLAHRERGRRVNATFVGEAEREHVEVLDHLVLRPVKALA